MRRDGMKMSDEQVKEKVFQKYEEDIEEFEMLTKIIKERNPNMYNSDARQIAIELIKNESRRKNQEGS